MAAHRETAMSPLRALLVHTPTFIIIKPGCPFCGMALTLLNRENIKYEKYLLSEVPEADQEITDSYRHRTYPKIFLDREFVGGYDKLSERYKTKPL